MSRSQSRTYWLVWLGGVMLYVAAALPDVVAYMLVPQIVCSTIACLRLVMVTVLAYLVLGEQVGRRECFGMALCTCGALLCMVYGPKADESTYDHPIDFLAGKKAAYLAVGFLLLGTGIVLSTRPALQYRVFPPSEALADGLEHILITAVGFASSPTALLREPVWWLIFLAIGCLAITVFCFNIKGAKVMPVNVFVPMSFAFRTVIQFFQSAVILDEFAHLAAHCTILSVVGASVALLGALFIQPPGAGAGIKDRHNGDRFVAAHVGPEATSVEASTSIAPNGMGVIFASSAATVD